MGRDRSQIRRQITFERTLRMLETEANKGNVEEYKRYRVLVSDHLKKLDERVGFSVRDVSSKTESKPTVKIKVAAKESKATATGPAKTSTKRNTESKPSGVRKPSTGGGAE